MILETVESPGLAQLSYVVGDEDAGVCAVIDPRRDVGAYLEIAERHEARITHILETHIHADFVSGSQELAAQTGAPVGVGAEGSYGFKHTPLADGESIALGELRLEVLHTPGHTPEHLCYLVSGGEGAGDPWGLFSGDTLFAGDVGRPDLLGGGTEERLARDLYHSLHEKLLRLDDGVALYPGHGSGSPCGAQIGDRKTSTIGYERRHNPALQVGSEDEFVRHVLGSLPPAPSYYKRLKKTNADGPPVLGCIAHVPALPAGRFREEMDEAGAVVLDTREIEAFGGAHVAGALNIALRESFPIWAGWMLQPEQRVLLVPAEEEDVHEIQLQLLRVGLDQVVGALREGMRGWLEAGLPFARLPQMSVQELKERVTNGHRDGLQVLDARRDDEWSRGRVPTALHIYLPEVRERLHELDPNRPVAVYCGSGFRAGIGASILERAGFREVYNVPGGMKAWRAAGYALDETE